MLLVLSVAAVILGDPATSSVKYCDSVMIEQTRSALSRLRAAAEPLPAACTVTYEGTVEVEGHLMRPGMTLRRPVRLEAMFDTDSGSVMVRESSGAGRSTQVETTVLRNGRVAKQDRASASFRELTTDRAVEAAALERWFPALIARAALAAGASCRPGPAVKTGGGELTPVSFSDGAGRACTLLLNEQDRVERVERLVADGRLGDVCNWTVFSDWQDRHGVAVPARLVRFEVLDSITVRYELSLASFTSSPVPPSAFDLPPEHADGISGWSGPAPVEGIVFVEIEKGVWGAEIGASDSRVLVVERDRDLAVLETSAGDAVCTRLIEALRRRFPGKPVTVAAFGHHHPASAGGVRAFAAAGATIVAPRAMESFLRDALGRPTTLGLPAVSVSDAKIEFFDGERTIDAGAATVRLIDIGERSAHAFSYVVFFFPESGVLFEGDLGFFPVGRPFGAGPRIEGLVGEMGRLGVKPRRLIQAWPVNNARREVLWEEVIEAVRKARVRPKP